MSLILILSIADIITGCGTVKFVDFCVRALYTLEVWIAPGDKAKSAGFFELPGGVVCISVIAGRTATGKYVKKDRKNTKSGATAQARPVSAWCGDGQFRILYVMGGGPYGAWS